MPRRGATEERDTGTDAAGILAWGQARLAVQRREIRERRTGRRADGGTERDGAMSQSESERARQARQWAAEDRRERLMRIGAVVLALLGIALAVAVAFGRLTN
jgi:hypothetical protein